MAPGHRVDPIHLFVRRKLVAALAEQQTAEAAVAEVLAFGIVAAADEIVEVADVVAVTAVLHAEDTVVVALDAASASVGTVVEAEIVVVAVGLSVAVAADAVEASDVVGDVVVVVVVGQPLQHHCYLTSEVPMGLVSHARFWYTTHHGPRKHFSANLVPFHWLTYQSPPAPTRFQGTLPPGALASCLAPEFRNRVHGVAR